MSTSGDQGTRPLTRRELRELRATGGEAAVREALEKSEQNVPASEPATPSVVAEAPVESGTTPPLTRKEMRRLRTNEVPIVTPEQIDEAEPADESPAQPSEVERDEAEHDDVVPTTISTEIPTLNPAFGAGVSERTTHEPERKSFDDLMEQSTATSPSSIIMTSSHRLPEGIGSTGAAKGTTDGADVDAVLIDGELPPASSPTPIAASAAISTQKSASEVIRPPAPEKGRGLLLALGVTAGVLGIVAIGTLATLYFTGVFNQ